MNRSTFTLRQTNLYGWNPLVTSLTTL